MLKYVLTVVLTLALSAVAVLLALAHYLKPQQHGFPVQAFAEDKHPPRTPESLCAVKPLTRRPNIVVILADDLGAGDLGAYGGRVLRTPNIDRLAAEGMRLTAAYASAPVCSPSRAGLLTGRYPLRSGIMAAMQMAADTPMRKLMHRLGVALSQTGSVDLIAGENAVRGLPPSEVTLPEALGVAGYRSKAIGKWHLGDFTVWPEFHPMAQGFGDFTGFNGSNDDFPVAFWRGRNEVLADIGAEQQGYTRLFTEEATAFIASREESPFFLYLAQKDPHLPFYPSELFAGNSAGGPYGDAVEELDWSIGEVLAALERSGKAQDTIVVFTSDNGPWFDGATGGLRGRKGTSYEGGFRVPLIVRWPGTIAPGTVSHFPTMNIDLMPTLLAAAGVTTPSDRTLDGIDLAPVLTGGAGAPKRPLFFSHGYDIEAVRLGDWKYVASMSHGVWPVPLDKPDSLLGPALGGRDYTPPGTNQRIPTLGTWPMLYHIAEDNEEAYNVARSNPAIVESLARLRDTFAASLRTNPRGWKQETAVP
jgi:arylsulfatase A-like enzyme